MGVVVQLMVDPRCAGVMFTRSPMTGDASVIVIEGCWGLGSALVSGDVTPDSYVVSKVTGEIVKRTVASKCASTGGTPPVPGCAWRRCRRHCVTSPAWRTRRSPRWPVSAGGSRNTTARRRTSSGRSPAAAPPPRRAPTAPRIVLLQSRPETVWSRRAAAPVATPKPRAFDHVLERLRVPGTARWT